MGDAIIDHRAVIFVIVGLQSESVFNIIVSCDADITFFIDLYSSAKCVKRDVDTNMGSLMSNSMPGIAQASMSAKGAKEIQ